MKQMERRISELEGEVKQLNHLLESPDMAQNPQKLSEVCTSIALAETKIEQLYLRWAELDGKFTQKEPQITQ